MQKPIIFQSFTKVFADSQIQAAFCKVEVSEILKHTFCGIIQNTLEIICQQIIVQLQSTKILLVHKNANFFWRTIKLKHWAFLYCSPYKYCSSNFTIVVALKIFFFSSVLYIREQLLFCIALYIYRSSNYCSSICCCFFVDTKN